MIIDQEIKKISKKLEDHEYRIKQLEEKDKKEKIYEDKVFDDEQRLEKFSKDIGISKAQLKNIFDFNAENVSLKKIIEGESKKEKQFKATLCILTANHFFLGKDGIDAKDLVKQLKWLGIGSLSNLNSNLDEYKEYIKSKGKRVKGDFTYYINLPGIEEGKKIIRELTSS